MTTDDLLDLLTEAIAGEHPRARVYPRDDQMIVRLPDGTEFHVTVRRHAARVEDDGDDDEHLAIALGL